MNMKINRIFSIILIVCIIISTLLVGVVAVDKPETPKVTTQNALKGVQVDWNKVDGAVKYNVYRKKSNEKDWIYLTTINTSTTFVDEDVVSGVTYVYSVRAYNEDGVYSDYVSANTQTRKYMAVPKLTSISNATNGLYIKWNAVSGVTNGYRVYRRGAGSTYWTYLCTTKNLYYTDTAVNNLSGDYFRYTVIADGGYHSKFDTTGLYLRRLTNPASIKTNIVNGGVSVSWAAVKGAGSYNVYRRASGESSWTFLGNVNSTAYIDYKVIANKYYKYTVRAVSGTTLSYFNDGALTKYMKAPGVYDYASTTRNVTVKWNAITGATGYRVYRRGAGEGWKLLATVSGTSYTDSNVTKNAYYRYTIRSVSGSYMSGYDNNGYLLKFAAVNRATSTGNDILNNPLAAYQKAASSIAKNGAAGYSKRNWQNLEKEVQLQNFAFLGNTLTDVLRGFLTKEEDAEVTVCQKGSADAKSRMPVSECSSNFIKSATARKSGDNYIVTIVLKDYINPLSSEQDGLNILSNDFVSYDSIIYTVENNSAFRKIVRNIDNSKIVYKDYVITATMNSKGEFVNIKHSGIGAFDGYVSFASLGETYAMCDLSVNAHYFDFVY